MKRIECEHCKNGCYEDDKLRCRLKQCKPDYADMWEIRTALLDSFEKSFFNDTNEFIAHKYSNTYFRMEDCEYPIDVESKVLEWLSRSAYKGQPYSQEWRNRKFRTFMKNGINIFLDTDFSDVQFGVIYQKLGNRINHDLTVKFIESDYDFSLLN